MTKEMTGPKPIDSWQGTVKWLEEDQGVFITDLYFPNEANAVDYVEEVEVQITSLPDEERTKLGKLSCFSCTVELDEASESGLKEIRDITFLPPVPITPEMVAKASEEFAFLSDSNEGC